MPGARVVGLLLAAGRGRRFAAAAGPGADKLTAALDGVPVARRALDALAAGCDAIVAVHRPAAPGALLDALRGARLVVAPRADDGMGHSLAQAALAAMEDGADAVLVLPADMPWVRPETVRRIAEAAREGPPSVRATRIVVPTLADGRRGHPVAFGAAHLDALAALTGDRGARALLGAASTTPLPTDDAGILRDVDTPSDLPSP